MEDQNASKAWYRKYRPYTMAEYSGERIKNVVSRRFTVPENRPNVMMIYGTKGCGKTTFARIISKYYLCENPINGEPCEQCEVCRSINEVLIDGVTGVECPGVTELDATVDNGKDAIQEVISDAEIEPIYTKYKVLIFDECHKISKTAQNSLLKIIEDIPPHLIVIFATTDPDEVIGTIHSRCQLKLEARRQSVEDMANRLLYICQQEGTETSMEALRLIAKKGDRVPRDCINLLEDVAKNFGNKVLLDDVIAYTGDIGADIYMKFFEAANSGLSDVLKFVKMLKDKDMKVTSFFSGLMRFSLDAMYVKHGISLDDYTVEFVKSVKKLYEDYASGDFDTLLQIVEYASNHISNDDAKNEVLLVTTAMRIGKIKLLAAGLNHEQSAGMKENRESITQYHNRMGSASIDPEELKQDISADLLTREFRDLKGVSAKAALSDAANIPLRPNTESIGTDKKEKESDYLSEQDILSLVDGD